MGESTFPRTRWSEIAAGTGGAAAYQKRFDDLEAAGEDVHGEARLVASLVTPPARVLDAGCGTGRVASMLTRLGYLVTGVDVEEDMIALAARRDPETRWVRQDLADLYLRAQTFEAIVLAGNVIPLLAPGTLPRTMRRIADHVKPGGFVVAGFGLARTHLPPDVPVTELPAYDRACMAAGLSPLRRYATWDRQQWQPGGRYAVSLHVRN